ncbi:primase C-terminal domain-containing protein [Mammaliicoccus sciuri]|uniref:primase C-terminal domain-containing protein n=1 Tax=Mammaliicoccus sciuri TaxID=1296 RepID=UPI00194E1CB8|nr:primase C-terminal domain-containing protein [Mammaliicoccus sciuri]
MFNQSKAIDLDKIYDFIMHGSIEKYKYNHSKYSKLERNNWKATRPANYRSGRVAVTNSKEMMKAGKGHVVSSEETLVNGAENYTHWTPNPYHSLTRDEKTNKLGKRDKENVKQINTLAVDIDKNYDFTELIFKLAMWSNTNNTSEFMPNLIVETPRGWHLYFVLDNPFYPSKTNKKALRVAESIHRSLIHSLEKNDNLPIDKNCVPIGFFRAPNSSNVKHFTNEYISSHKLMQWSKKYSKENNLDFNGLNSLPGVVNSDKTPDWVYYLMNEADITSFGYGVGRNNTVFTLALYYKSIGESEETTYELLESLNSRFSKSLSINEFRRTIRSAFKGKYKGASRFHVENLLEAYSNGEVMYNNSFVAVNGFYKHAKPREERQRSHYYERLGDLQEYLEERTDIDKVFMKGSTTAMSKELGMARSVLDKVTKKAIKEGLLVKYTKGKGRYAETFIALKKVFIQRVFGMVKSIKEQKAGFSKALRSLLNVSKDLRTTVAQNKGLYEELTTILSYIDDIQSDPLNYDNSVTIATRNIS